MKELNSLLGAFQADQNQIITDNRDWVLKVEERLKKSNKCRFFVGDSFAEIISIETGQKDRFALTDKNLKDKIKTKIQKENLL